MSMASCFGKIVILISYEVITEKFLYCGKDSIISRFISSKEFSLMPKTEV